MKTVHILGNGKAEVIEVAEPEPVDSKVVVKIESSLICGTEKGMYLGPNALPDNGGHEAAGVVYATDKSEKVKEGDHVTVFLSFTHCHRCPACLSGEWLHCWYPPPRVKGRRGTHSQYILVPDYLCLPVPQDMPFDHAALVGDCFGTPFRALKRLGINGSDTVLVTGSGPMGVAAARLAKFYGATVIATSTNEYRFEQMSKDAADYVFNPKKDDVVAKVRELTDNRGATVALECCGAESAQRECLDAVGVLGKIAFLGLRNEHVPVNLYRHLNSKELMIIGSWASTPPEHFDILGLIKRGMPVDGIITHRYGMNDGAKAFEKFGAGGAMKIAIHPWDD
ncbi:MAG: zinc-binding dehydrogenase [Desulfobacterales bacterium]